MTMKSDTPLGDTPCSAIGCPVIMLGAGLLPSGPGNQYRRLMIQIQDGLNPGERQTPTLGHDEYAEVALTLLLWVDRSGVRRNHNHESIHPNSEDLLEVLYAFWLEHNRPLSRGWSQLLARHAGEIDARLGSLVVSSDSVAERQGHR